MSAATINRQQHRASDWSKPYSPVCVIAGCLAEPHYDRGTYYSCCRDHLKKLDLTPFRKRIVKEDYSELFWTTDYERKKHVN